MSTNEKTTKEAEKKDESQLTMVKSDETLQLALDASTGMLKMDVETPEHLLTLQAQRLNNVAHSLVEERETNYLEGKSSENLRKIDRDDLDAICRLSDQARMNLKTAADIQKDKINAVANIVRAVKGK